MAENTPQKFNMEPENDGFQKESPFPGTSFQVPCLNFRGVNGFNWGYFTQLLQGPISPHL